MLEYRVFLYMLKIHVCVFEKNDTLNIQYYLLCENIAHRFLQEYVLRKSFM